MAFSGLGAGTVGDPYQITTKAQFQEIASNLDKYFIQMNDIDLNGLDCSTYSTFTGNFDGKNYRLLNVVEFFPITGGTFKNSRITRINLAARHSIFPALSGAIITDVSIRVISGSTSVAFADSIVSSTQITNVTMYAELVMCIAVTSFSSSTLNNCIFHSTAALTLGYTLNVTTINVTFNDCKFLSTDKVFNGCKDKGFSACTFNRCLFYGSWYFSTYTGTVSAFNDTAFIQDVEWTRTGSLSNQKRIFFETGYNGNFNRCYFGGQMNIRHQSFTEGTGLSYKLGYAYGGNGIMTDCHIGFNFNPTFDITSVYTTHGILPDSYSGNPVRVFCDATVSQQLNAVGLAVRNGTNCFINSSRIKTGSTQTANYGLLTEAQTKTAANFTGFDFTNVWQINEGISSPKLRNTIYSQEPYLLNLISSVSVARQDATHELLSINTNRRYTSGAINVYVSTTLAGIENPANLVAVNTISDSLVQAYLPVTEGNFYVLVKYINGIIIEDFSVQDFHYAAAQPATTTINIVSPNYVNFTNPRVSYLHGLCFYNGYIYGSTRGQWDGTDYGFSLVKLKADDYTVVATKKLYLDKVGSTSPYGRLDQIVFCNGFLWCQSHDTIIRINPSDLDYIPFRSAEIATAEYYQPIGTDGQFLFVSGDSSVAKFDSNYLTGSFASYGYTGTHWALTPAGSCVGVCTINQVHPTLKGYVHSIISDSTHIYIACTTCTTPNGYDNGTYILFLQKINKSNMTSEGTITIPQCTDDMVQNAEWLFLAPEYDNISPDIFGSDYGLIAIRKSNLELKYLKALHKDFNTVNEADRAAHGVQYFAGKIIVQLIASRKSVVINTANVESWGPSFPIGGATEVIYQFQKDGVLLTQSPNELVIDNNNWVHISNWGNYTDILKFPLSAMSGIDKTPIVQTTLIAINGNNATIAGYVIEQGKSAMTSGGFKWGTNPEALTNDLTADQFSYDFQEIIANLAPGVYYAQAYGTNTEGTFYGNTVMFSVVQQYNAVSLHNNDTIALLEFLDTHFGCSIRCVQDAPGVPTGTTGTATDQDGNVYDTVVINEKRWMVQNLKTKKYRNGDAIPKVSDATAWAGLSSGGYCDVN